MRVIQGGLDKEERSHGVETWTCHVCGGVTVVSLITAPVIHKGKIKGGTERLHCADCFLGGIKTPVALARD